MTVPKIDTLFMYMDKTYQQSPVRQRSKTVGAWVFDAGGGGFHFSLTRRKGYVHLSDVWVAANRRDRGIGKTGMRCLMSILDQYGVPCTLDVRGYDGGMGTRHLKKWYASFGFIAFRRNAPRMGRLPE